MHCAKLSQTATNYVSGKEYDHFLNKKERQNQDKQHQLIHHESQGEIHPKGLLMIFTPYSYG